MQGDGEGSDGGRCSPLETPGGRWAGAAHAGRWRRQQWGRCSPPEEASDRGNVRKEMERAAMEGAHRQRRQGDKEERKRRERVLEFSTLDER
jgi:hypothetical protein